MKSEYVKLSPGERVYGQRHLLYSRLELLELLRRFGNYKVLRSEEFYLKVTLKAKISETLALLQKLDKLLPKSTYREPKHEKVERKERKISTGLSLHDEIDFVKKKIENLQKGI